eukprot:TRINITY_DN26314_c0_g1_i1.p1 TRINITY_DN26314_c0_g1~~TRINITY_DN26314_c0_g1_i1.p1  ORF type:complete len:604 (-),score=72.92 TRINITY_DN26314_c0_g1_i1:256-2016(-)
MNLEHLQLDGSRRPVLVNGEVEIASLSKVDIEFSNLEATVFGATSGSQKYKDGRCVLTSHRLFSDLWGCAVRMNLEHLQLDGSRRPVLVNGEVEIASLSKVDIEFSNLEATVFGATSGSQKYKDGRCVLTSHRLLYIDYKQSRSCFWIPLGAVHSSNVSSSLFGYTKLKIQLGLDYYNKPAQDGGVKFDKMYIHSHGHESLQGFHKSLEKAVKQEQWQSPAQQQSQAAYPYQNFIPTPAANQNMHAIKPDPTLLARLPGMGFQSFRCEHALIAISNQGVEEAVNWLISPQNSNTNQNPGWGAYQMGYQQQYMQPFPQQNSIPQQPGPTNYQQAKGVNTAYAGVGGILRKEAENAHKTDSSLSQAFQDMKNLMDKAQEMVHLADKLKNVLLSKEKDGSSEEGTEDFEKELQDDMISMGIASPVTRESAGAQYYKELARQLSQFLCAPMKKSFGMMTLQDTFCWFNRARGVELVSPDDLKNAVAQFPKIKAPYQMKELSGSGVMVIVSNEMDEKVICCKIGEMVKTEDVSCCGIPLTASKVAHQMGVPLSIAQEHLFLAEKKLILCRDDGPEGLRFFRNFFMDPFISA